MSPDQLREYVTHTRTLRTSPPAFSKQLRSEVKEPVDAETQAKKKKSIDQMAGDYL